MITVDDRVGAVELAKLFPPGLTTVSRLQYGDMSFVGEGQNGVPYLIGIERKKVRDLINCIASGRLSGHQLIGMLNAYNIVYLVIEGLFRANPETGMLEVWKARRWNTLEQGRRCFMARDVWAFLETIRIVTGVQVWHTANEDETVQWVRAVHYWWTHKEFEEHRGHLAMHMRPVVELSKQSLVQRVAQQLKGVGYERAKEVHRHFKSVAEMVMADESEWGELEGFGDKLSRSAVAELRGGRDG